MQWCEVSPSTGTYNGYSSNSIDSNRHMGNRGFWWEVGIERKGNAGCRWKFSSPLDKSGHL